MLSGLLCARLANITVIVSFDCCYNDNDGLFCAIRLHKQSGHVFKQGSDVMLEAGCQLCEHRVSRGGKETERRWVGVNVTEQSLVILPCYSDLFVILPQMFAQRRSYPQSPLLASGVVG